MKAKPYSGSKPEIIVDTLENVRTLFPEDKVLIIADTPYQLAMIRALIVERLKLTKASVPLIDGNTKMNMRANF